jgi:hypothetical protein
LKWLIRASRSGGARISIPPAHAASPPWAAGQDPGDGRQGAVEGELAEGRIGGDLVARQDVHGGEQGEGDGEVEVAAFLP